MPTTLVVAPWTKSQTRSSTDTDRAACRDVSRRAPHAHRLQHLARWARWPEPSRRPMNVDHYSKSRDAHVLEPGRRSSPDHDGRTRTELVDPRKHRQLAEVWSAIDRDPTRVPCWPGPARVFGGRQLRAARRNDRGLRHCPEVLREARDLVNNVINCSKPIVSAMWGRRWRRAVAGLLADVPSPQDGAHHRRPRLGVAAGDHAAICWPLLCGMAKQVLPAHPP